MAASMTMFSTLRQGQILSFRRNMMRFGVTRTCSSVSGTVTNDSDVDQEHIPFWNLMEMRRKQADNTILVRLCDKTPLTTLLQFCSSHGKVKHHFSYHQQGRYAYVEFKTAAALQSLLQHTGQNGHNRKTKNTQFIHSRFLTFSRAGKKKEKENSVLNKQPVHRSLMNKICQTNSVSEQINTLMQEEQLREPEVRLRFLVCSLMEEAFKKILPDCTLYPFGSTVNSFGKRNCDIDMYLDRGTAEGMIPLSQGKEGYKLTYDRQSAYSERVATQTTLFTLASFLEKHVPHCGSVFRILNARCPLVKFKHHATGLSCDLTGDNRLALKSSELLYIYGQLDHRVRPLVFLVRHWARFHGITSVHPGSWITNFPLTLLVLFFLQTRSPPVVTTMNHLTSLADETDRAVIHDTDCTLVSDISKVPTSENEENLEQLLHGFFQFLCEFNFDRQGVSIKRGESFPNLDENFPLHIENPFETDLNASKNVTLELVRKIRKHSKEALNIMHDPEFQKSEENALWGLPHLFVLPSNAKKGLKRSPGLGKRLGNILTHLSK